MDRIKDHPQISHNAEKMIGEFPTKECKFSIFNRDNTLDLVGKDIQIFRGLLLEDNTIEYIPQGIFHVNPDDLKTNSTAKTIELTIKDKSIDFDCPYGGLNKINYPCTLGEFINEIITRHGFILETPDFPFSNLVLKERPNFDLNTATERYLISSAGEIGGCTTQMSRTGGVRISKPYLTGITIKKIDYKKLPSKEKQFGPINQVSLSRSNVDNDDILSKDNASISQNGLCEWKIFDNPYVDLIRETIVDQVASNLFGMTIIPFELEDTIDSYLYDINDSVSVIDKMNNIFNTTILSISSSSRIFTKLKASVQTKIEANVKLAGSSKEILNQVRLDVDHNKQRIEALASEVTENTEKTNKLEMTVDETKQTISKVETTVEDMITTTQTSSGGNHLYLEKALEQDVLEYHIKGKSEQETTEGKNLFDYTLYNKSGSGLTTVLNEDGSLTTSGVPTGNYSKILNVYDIDNLLENGKTYTFSQKETNNKIYIQINIKNKETGEYQYNALNYNTNSKSFIANKNLYSYSICIQTSTISNWGTESQNITNFYQLEEGNVATDFEKYTGGQPSPSPDYPSEINTIAKEGIAKLKITGKNLLNAPYNEEDKLTRTATKNDDYKSTDFYAELEAGKQYTFSCKTDGTFGIGNDFQTECYLLLDKKYDYILSMRKNEKYIFTVNQSGKYYLRTDVNFKDETHSFWNFQIEEGEEATPFEEYKEREVLIDLNQYDEEGNVVGKYELSSLLDGTSNDLDIVDGQVILNERIGKIVLDGTESWSQNSGKTLFYTPINGILDFNNNAKAPNLISDYYLPISFNNGYSGEFDYGITYNHTQKAIAIRNKNCLDINQFVESLKENPVIIYYELEEPQQIILPNVQIPLFEGINHISLVEDLETETGIKYLRETPFSKDYALNVDLDKTNSNLSNTNHQLGQAQSDINATNTHLNNDFYDKNQIDSMQTSTEQLITQIKNQVEMTTNSTNLQISVLQEKLINGITSVVTETGYRFDKDGLSISKTGEPMKSVLDNEGLIVYRDTTIKLKVSGDEVYTDNLIVNTYLIQRPIRREQGVSISDGKSVGVVEHWIGSGN